MSTNGQLTVCFFDIWQLQVQAQFHKYFYHHDFFLTPSLSHIVSSNRIADHIKYLIPQDNKDFAIAPEIGRIRVSMSALVDIQVGNEHGLIIQKKVIKPVGGALQFINLPPIDSIKLENPHSLDLRFTIDQKDLPAIQSWFHTKENRETSPVRELEEELTQESGVIPTDVWQEFLKTF